MTRSDFRYERKFVMTGISREQIEGHLRFHPSVFREIYQPRYVNNIYFDSLALENYRDSIDGTARRMKVRIRWYGDLFGRVDEPKLELKEKQGLVNRKHTAPVNGFTLDAKINQAEILRLLRTSELPPSMSVFVRPMRAFLLNRYLRRYWISRDGHFRVTLDSNMTYYRMIQVSPRFSRARRDARKLILELKYQKGIDADVTEVSRHFGCRLGKSSKYVTGMNLVYGFLNIIEAD